MNVVKKWAYYNEFEPYAAAWIRNLITLGLVAPGEVDERSILDVQPDDLKGFTQVHFFAGIAGWSRAARLVGWPDDRPLWTGSCPCQPFSVAGKGEGQKDERHLWPVFFGLIRSCRPAVVFGEQVAVAAGARPEPEFDLQRAVETLAAAQPGTFLRDTQGQPFREPRFEHDLGREETSEAQKFALRLGSISAAIEGAAGEGPVRIDRVTVQDERRSAGLEHALAGSGGPGGGLRDRERPGDSLRGERDDAHLGSRNDNEDDRRADGEGTGTQEQFSDSIRGEPEAPTAKDWLDGVYADFQTLAYTCGASIVPCCAVNAPHRRDRLWFVAEPDRCISTGWSDLAVGRPEGRDATWRSGEGSDGALAFADSFFERQGHSLGGGREDGDRSREEPGLGGACDGDVANGERLGREMALFDAGSRAAEDRDGQADQSGMRGARDGDVADAPDQRERGKSGELGETKSFGVREVPGERDRQSEPRSDGEAFGLFDGFVADASSGDAQRRGRSGIVPGAAGEVEGQLSQLAAASDHREGNSNGHDVDHAIGAGLEGLSGHGDDWDRPGRDGAEPAGPVAAAGGAVPDPDLFGSSEEREQRSGELGGSGGDPGHRHWDAAIWVVGADGKARRVGARLRRLVDGLPDELAGMRAGEYAEYEIETIPLLAHGVKARVGKLRALGNAIAPPLAAEVLAAYLDTHP